MATAKSIGATSAPIDRGYSAATSLGAVPSRKSGIAAAAFDR
jgi:hypothetical protein